jgi:hypothetical protein
MRLEQTPLLTEFHRQWVKIDRALRVSKLYDLLIRR